MSNLEINLKNTRPRPHHLETTTDTTSTRSRPQKISLETGLGRDFYHWLLL